MNLIQLFKIIDIVHAINDLLIVFRTIESSNY